jgi:hypothetical protein
MGEPCADVPGAGVGIDRYGVGAIDPSANVLALVNAQAIFQEKIDAAAAKAATVEFGWVIKYFEALMSAEQLRVDGLAVQKKDYDNKIGDSQTVQMKTTSDLVSTQLDKVTKSLSDTINKTADNIKGAFEMMNERLSKVEQFRYETGGKTSMADPAMVGVLADIAALKIAKERAVGQTEHITSQTIADALQLQKQSVGHGGTQNTLSVVGVAVSAAVGLVIAIVSLAVAFYKQPSPMVDYSGVTHSQHQSFFPSKSHEHIYMIRGD